MRCPKCSFISFDDLVTCAKCSNDLSVIAAELQGTCTETKPPFFLSSVVESLESADQTFSGSQVLSSIDDTDISFDDTSSGGEIPFSFSADADQTLTGFDESIEISDDEISLELGDIMPIDLDQLDEPLDLEDDTSLDLTEAFSLESGEGLAPQEDFDLDLTTDFDDQSAEFDRTEILSTDALEGDIDLNLTGDFDENVDLDLSGDFEAFDLDETSLSLEPAPGSEDFKLDGYFAEGDSLDLDEDLQATLTGDFPAPEGDATEAVEFDASLLDELNAAEEDELLGEDLLGDIGEGLEDFDLDETSISLEPISDSGDFKPEDTLSEFDSFDLELAEVDSGLQDEYLTLDDTQLEELQAEPATEEQLGDELLPTMDEELDLEELDSGLQDEELTLDDSQLEELQAGEVTEEQLGDELLATMDEELDLDLEELETGPQEDELELSLDDSPLEELQAGEATEEQLGDELLATMDEELDLDLEELTSDQQDEELTFDSSQFEELQDEEGEDLFEPGKSPSLGLEQIDVSDLISSSDDDTSLPPDDEELDLASLMEEDEEGQDSDLEMLDEEIPELELIEEEDDEGPPDLPG